jgi:hypothetical protein
MGDYERENRARSLEEFLPPDLPLEARGLRLALWPAVNIVLPLRFTEEAAEADYLAMKPMLLPRVPRSARQTGRGGLGERRVYHAEHRIDDRRLFCSHPIG